MQAAGVLWPGLQLAKTIKERKALYDSGQVGQPQIGWRPELKQV